jgi:hypothetical protein
MWSRVAYVRTYVSEERITSAIRVTRIGEIGTTLAATNNWSVLRKIQLIVTANANIFLWKVDSYKSHRHHIQEDGILHGHRLENLKS